MPTLHLFGTPRLCAPARADVPLSAREAALLAWLHLEGPSPRARIAGLLWPGGGEAQARANLRQALARLRRQAPDVLAEADGVLRLAEAVAVAAADPAASPAAQRLLGGLEFDDAPAFAEWLQARRDAALREWRRERLAQARRHLDEGALDAALAAADAVLAFDPAVEEAHRLRMEAFHLRGDRAAAIGAWDDCRDALRGAFGVAPSAATQELGRLVLAAEAGGAVAAAVLPAALRRPPRLVGREATLAVLQHALALGHGVVVAGPGGIGKSRLLGQAAAAFAPALCVGARPGDLHLPGVLFSRLLAEALERFAPALDTATRADIAWLLPGGPPLLSADAHRRGLASLVRAVLACHASGLRLLVVDDLHHADDLSLQALAALVEQARADPALPLPLLGCRPDDLRPPAAALVQDLAGSARGARIDLAPLSAADLQVLLDSLPLPAGAADLPALAQALHARVGGNPAFVLESVKALWLAGWQPGAPLVVPATLRDTLRQRLQRLGAEALQLAQLAALAQEDFSLALAAAALGRPPLALAPLFAELEAAQVLDGVRFSHDLVAEAARAAVPGALVAPLHRLVAEHLQARQGAPARIAWHLQQAGESAAAVPWHLAAGRSARDRWQLAEAARHFEAAALGLEQAPRDGPAPAHTPAVPPAHMPADTPAVTPADTWLQAARWRTAVSDFAAALHALQRGLAASPTAAERLELQASRVVVLLNAQREAEATEEAAALAGALQAQADALRPERLAAALFACTAVAPYSPQPQTLAALCEALRPRCEGGPARARLSFHLAVGTCLNWLGRPQPAAADLERARQLADAAGDHASMVNVSHQGLRNALLRGDAAQAEAAAAEGARAVQAGGFGRSFRLAAQAAQALAALAAGRPAAAWTALHALQAELAGLDPHTEAEAAAARAVVLCALGRADLAAQGLPACEGWPAFAHWRLAEGVPARRAALAAMARRWPADDGAMGWRRRLLAARLDAPGPADAERMAQALHARALAPLARQAHAIAARAWLAAGDAPRAAAQARALLALADAVDPWTDEPAFAWAEAAALLRAAGEGAEAAAALAAGRAWLAQAAAPLAGTGERRAWLEGVPLHRLMRAAG